MKPNPLLCVVLSSNIAHRQLLKSVFGAVSAAMLALCLSGCQTKSTIKLPPKPSQTTLNQMLLDAAERDNTANVVSALNQGADANATDSHQMTAINWTIPPQEEAIVQVLITHGADVNHQGSYGGTPLMSAVSNIDALIPSAQVDEVTFLLKHGAKINAKDGEKRTALFYACAYNWPDTLQIIRLLVAHGATIHYKDMHGVSPIQEAKKRGYLDVVRLLLQLDQKKFRASDLKESAVWDANGLRVADETPLCKPDTLRPPGHNTYVYVFLEARDLFGQMVEGYRRCPKGFCRIADLDWYDYDNQHGVIVSPDRRFLFTEQSVPGRDPGPASLAPPPDITAYTEYRILLDGHFQKVTNKWLYGSHVGPFLTFAKTGRTAYMVSDEEPWKALSFRVTPNGHLLPLGHSSPLCGKPSLAFVQSGPFLYALDDESRIWQYKIASDGQLVARTPPYLYCGFDFVPSGMAAMPNEGSIYLTADAGYSKHGDVHGRIFQFGVTNGLLHFLTPPIIYYGKHLSGIQAAPDGHHVYVSTNDGVNRVFSVTSSGTLKPTSVYLNNVDVFSYDDQTDTTYGISLSDGNLRVFKSGRDGTLTPLPGFAARQSARVNDLLIIHR